MVMDLNKCLGCQTCTVACKQLWTDDEGMEYMWWNSVSTMPGQGTPRGWEDMGGGFDNNEARAGKLPTVEEFGEAWEFNHEAVFYGGEQQSLQVKGKKPDWGPNWDEDQGAGHYPNAYYFYLPRICNHCSKPACVAACPRGAISKRKEDGIVLVDEDRCRGYRFCMEACPYKKIYFNHQRKISQKCIFCFPRVENGVAPACARQCPGRVRFVGYKDDKEGPIYKLVTKWKVAVPLHPEYGTDPNVFYVPPTGPMAFDAQGNFDAATPRIPEDYLRSLFGQPGVEALQILKAEISKKRRGEGSEVLDTLIAYKWNEMFGGFERDPQALRWVDP
ncbi:MAG: respiratory nitrate reductase subunit beta [Halieaceae bacterium]|nr:respiratory nitrate reductase subunit beta [Halieaceae bacterium]